MLYNHVCFCYSSDAFLIAHHTIFAIEVVAEPHVVCDAAKSFVNKSELWNFAQQTKRRIKDTCLPHVITYGIRNVSYNLAGLNIALLLRVIDTTLVVLNNQFNQLTKVIYVHHTLLVFQLREDRHLLGKVHQTREVVPCKFAIDKWRAHDSHLEAVVY